MCYLENLMYVGNVLTLSKRIFVAITIVSGFEANIKNCIKSSVSD